MLIRESRLTKDAVALLASVHAPRIPWDDFVTHLFRPEPGEHVSIFGSTGKGKTALQNSIIRMYPFQVVFATKPLDRTMDKLIESRQYVKMTQWLRLSPLEVPRRVLWPNALRLDSVDNQKRVFKYALESIFREVGRPKENPVGWTVAIDEVWYFANILGLVKELKLFIVQARSLGHNMVLATQRPANVPLEMYSQATHVFLFKERERRNLERLGEINSADSGIVRAIVSNLEDFQVLYINTVTGEMWRTRIFPYMANGPVY